MTAQAGRSGRVFGTHAQLIGLTGAGRATFEDTSFVCLFCRNRIDEDIPSNDTTMPVVQHGQQGPMICAPARKLNHQVKSFLATYIVSSQDWMLPTQTGFSSAINDQSALNMHREYKRTPIGACDHLLESLSHVCDSSFWTRFVRSLLVHLFLLVSLICL